MSELLVRNRIWSLQGYHSYFGKLPLRYMVIMAPSDHKTPTPYCPHMGYRYFHKKVKDVTEREAKKFVDTLRIDDVNTDVYKDYELMQREFEQWWTPLESFRSAVRRMCFMSEIDEPEYIEILHRIQMGAMSE